MKKFEFPNETVFVPEACDEPVPKMYRPNETHPSSGHGSLTTLCRLAAKHEFKSESALVSSLGKHYFTTLPKLERRAVLSEVFDIATGGWDLSRCAGGGFKRGELVTMSALKPVGTEGLFPKTSMTAYMAAEMLRRNPGLIISFEESPMTKLMASMEGYSRNG